MGHAASISSPNCRSADGTPNTRRQAPTPSAKPLSVGAPQPARKTCACGGGCPRCQASRTSSRALRISQPGDAREREAERLAERGERRHAAQAHVHTDARAERMADLLQARAFTVGNDIYFGRNAYVPETVDGRRLLNHELAHVEQNQRAPQPHTMFRDRLPGESETRYFLREGLLRLIRSVGQRMRHQMARGPGGLYEHEYHSEDGRIRPGGPGTPTITLQERRARLEQLLADLGAMQMLLQRQQIPESWILRIIEELGMEQTQGEDGGQFGGFGRLLEMLFLCYEQYAREAGRDQAEIDASLFYISPMPPPRSPASREDTGIDVIAPYPDEPTRVARVSRSASVIQNLETGASIEQQPIHRVYRDERGYYYETGPTWLGPLRRVDLPGPP